MSEALIALIVLWWALITYGVLGGADFGAGIWDLFAVGRQAERQHDFINHALGPVWEANHVWLIFLIVGLFTIFPVAFAALSTALFFPFTFALIGIVLRGAAFVFRYYAVNAQGAFAREWGHIFSVTSLITPLFLGASAAAVASGNLLPSSGTPDASYIASWTSPFALVIGLMAVALCAAIAAVYMAAEASAQKDEELVQTYRWRAIVAGAATAILGALGLALSISEAPMLWNGMLTRAWPVALVAMLIGLGTAAALFTQRYRIARLLVIAETAFILGAWGLSQYPYIIPPHFTIANSANEPAVISQVLIALGLGMLILIPALYYLFSVFKLSYPVPGLRKEARQKAETRALKR